MPINLQEFLRRKKEEGCSISEMARMIKMSRATIKKYLNSTETLPREIEVHDITAGTTLARLEKESKIARKTIILNKIKRLQKDLNIVKDLIENLPN